MGDISLYPRGASIPPNECRLNGSQRLPKSKESDLQAERYPNLKDTGESWTCVRYWCAEPVGEIVVVYIYPIKGQRILLRLIQPSSPRAVFV